MTTDLNRLPVTQRMQLQIDRWHAAGDRRATFLACYQLMTNNMLSAIDAGEFNDAEWVYSLLHHFAEYYFDALDAYEQDRADTPHIWRQAHDAARQPGTLVIQNLLLGINAHINFDLIFAMVDMLEDDWAQLSPDERQGRYDDHCHVNDIIRSSIDAVQDTVIEPDEPLMDVIDKLFGPADEWVVSRLITQWRDHVWGQVQILLDISDSSQRQQQRERIEAEALKRAARMLHLSL